MERTIEQGYTVEQAAGLLNRSVVTIRRYIKDKKLKASKLGGAYIIPADEIRKYLS